MKLEQAFYVIASVAVAAADHAATMDHEAPSHEYLLWQASGTLVGAFIASQSVKSKTPAFARMAIAFVCGLIVAPWFIGYLPRSEEIPYLLHVFGSSGIAAACGYLIFTEYPKIVLEKIKGPRYNLPQANREERDDNDGSDGTSP